MKYCNNKYREAWRYTGPFTRAQRFRGLFPGFGTAAVAFAGYCVFEFMFLGGTDKHHDASAGSGSGDAH